MREQIKELIDKRNRLAQQGRDQYEKIQKEGRSMTDEEKKNDDLRFTEINQIADQIKRFERQLELERETAAAVVASGRAADAQTREQAETVADAQHRSRLIAHEARLSRLMSVDGDKSVRFSEKGLEARASKKYSDHHEAYLRGDMTLGELRALAADVATTGGYLVMPMQMSMDLIKAIDDEVFIRRFATKHLVVNADGLGMASLDADPADSDWTAEIATGSEDNSMAFGRRELKPYPLAKRIKVSNKLIRTAAQSVETLVRSRLAYKFGITEEKVFLLGTGANQPLGVFTPSNDGIPVARDVNSGATNNFTFPALFDVKYALKGGYLNRPTTAWGFHRDALKLIAKLVDGQNRPLWEPSVQIGQPDRLLGLPLFMSEFFPNTFTTGQYVGMLADWSYYHVADSLNMSVQRLNELYAETNQVGFIGRQEVDGMPVLAEAFVRIKTN